jgi:hypothetical protein
MLELNLVKKQWSNYANLEIQGTGLKKILAFGTKTYDDPEKKPID